MKYYITNYKNSHEKNELLKMGLFCYDLRSGDNGEIIASIEKRVVVNRVGSIITNKELIFDNSSNDFIDYDTFCLHNESVDSIDALFNKKVIRQKNNERNER